MTQIKEEERAFTIIELIVVVAIISVLASIIVVNVTQYINKAKVARANADVSNLAKALELFNAQYGDYPWGYYGYPDWLEFFPTIAGGEGDPFLTVNGQDHHLSEVYKQDWNGYNASYFVQNGYYYIYLYDNDWDGKIGCGYAVLYDNSWNFYGYKYILCQDCDYCQYNNDYPFQATTYW